MLAQHDKFKPSLYLLPNNLILIWIHGRVGMLPGGEHSWKSTVHKAGAFSLLLDEKGLLQGLFPGGKELSWVRVLMVSPESIPNIPGGGLGSPGMVGIWG